MNYRTLPNSGLQISEIGIGGGSLDGSVEEMSALLNRAIEAGINFFDIAPSRRAPFYAYAKAFEGRRDQILTQMHFGAYYLNDDGEYGWTRDLDKIKEQIKWQLDLLNTDYIDFGYLHCIDDQEDFDLTMSNGLWDYMKELKEKGVIRHLGFSSHNPAIARQLIDTGLVDLFMFSINPAYDYQQGEYALGESKERAELYQLAEENGIGITVMKPFGGGKLLDDKTSMFGKALTHGQCIQYALDRPAVMTVLPGIRTVDDLNCILEEMEKPESTRDYSVINSMQPEEIDGVCVYCNHCQPCPAGLNIGLINKYYDLAKAGDVQAAGHYENLSKHASNCLHCGHCQSRCPFHVRQEKRMDEIAEYFGY